MTTMCRMAGLMMLLAVLPAAAQPQPKEPTVTLKTVKYAAMAETIVQHRGKVVVVDLWGFF